MGLFEKLKNIMVLPDEDDFDEEYDEVETSTKSQTSYDDTPIESSPRLFQTRSKTVQYQPKPSVQVVLVKPDRFDDAQSIADHLNEKKTVVLNLESADRESSRRIIDFLSGVAYANHGNISKVANSTFIIVPSNVDVMGDLLLDDFGDGKLYF